jgi:hypothetical protein
MSLNINRSEIESYGIDYSIKDINGNSKRYQVTMQNSWSDTVTGRRGELFNVGGGSVYNSYPVNNFGFGSYTLTPNQNFLGHVNIWGAGGGAYHSSGGRMAGGGGYTQALIRFIKNTPYTIVVGQAGNHNATYSHGGGGKATGPGGGGGGLSGIFMGVDAAGSSAWSLTAPVTQAQALAIAGGGGGGGHHNQGSHYGNGGGGGGWVGKRGHNAGVGSQTGGGGAGYSDSTAGFALHGGNASTQNTWCGAGGAGWFGGGGAGHSGSHYDGGSGGSGHIAYPAAISAQPNNDKAAFILNGFTEKASGHMEYTDMRPANFNHPLNICEGRHAGMGGHGETNNSYGPTWGPRHGKVVITLYPEFMGKIQFPTHTSPHDSTGWTQSY